MMSFCSFSSATSWAVLPSLFLGSRAALLQDHNTLEPKRRGRWGWGVLVRQISVRWKGLPAQRKPNRNLACGRKISLTRTVSGCTIRLGHSASLADLANGLEGSAI